MENNQIPQKVLFIDRDGTIIKEASDEQIDSFDKLTFYPMALYYLSRIASELDYELVMVSNQDGLGTDSYPEDTFLPVHNMILKTFENEGVIFKDIIIDRTFAIDKAPTRKPGTALLQQYLTGNYDLKNSFVIGDRINDVILAKNMGIKAIWLRNNDLLGANEGLENADTLADTIALQTTTWKDIYTLLKAGTRRAEQTRKTSETNITIKLDLNGTGKASISTGLNFFDHM
ncbi:MAG: histidinol-phosphatase, partial [Chitinophagaceae bacterium]